MDRSLWAHEMNVAVRWLPYADSPGTAILVINSGENSNSPQTEPDEIIGTRATVLSLVFAMIDEVSIKSLRFSGERGIPRKEEEILAYSTHKFLTPLSVQIPVNER